MRTSTRSAATTAVVAAAAALFTLSGVTSAASAATVPAGSVAVSATDGGQMIAQGTRGFWITNLSSRTLTLDDAWGTTGWPGFTRSVLLEGDSVPVGRTLEPGQTLRIEVRDWSDHGITMIFGDGVRDQVAVNTHVSMLNRYSNGFSSYGRIEAGGQDVTLLDASGAAVVPGADR